MSSRREERLPLRLAANVWGMQDDGTLFFDQVRTNDISRMGARLTGFTHPVQVGMLLGIQQGTSTGRFRVVWVGEPATDRDGEVGVECVEIGQAVSKTVLILDNHDYELQMRRNVLEPAGFKVITAHQAAEVPNLLESSAVTAVVAAYPLHEGSVEQLLTYVRSKHENVRVLLLSPDPGAIPERVTAMADATLHKGATRAKLIDAVEALIGPAMHVKWPLTRISHRYNVVAPVEVKLVRGGEVSRVMGQTVDVSEDGMCMEAKLTMLPGEAITVKFSLPTASEALEIRGTVRHRKENQYGVEFIMISDRQQQAIRSLCSVLPPATAVKQ
jgi:ActR/RegA family two-component response regulator